MPNYHITRDDIKIYKGNPNGAITPDYIGQLCIDDLEKKYYISTNLNNNGWVASTVEVDVSNKQNITDNNLSTTNKTITGAINELKTNKQDTTDDSLSTTDKTITGAINELKTKVDETFQEVDSGKTLIAAAIDDPSVTKYSTFIAMSKAIANLKNSTNTGPTRDAADILYEMMLEDGYTNATSDMNTNELIELLDASQIELEISEIICGSDFTFILKNDGTVYACGDNEYGQLGLGNQNTKYSFTKVNINNVKQISCGGSHTVLVKNDGTVYACGYKLGLGNSTDQKTFTKVNIDNVKQVSCGFNYTFILKNDGTVYACGDNAHGQLGLGNSTDQNTFTKVNIDNVKQIDCGFYHTFILKNDGTVWACGNNEYGQLGLGSGDTKKYTFTKVNINNVKQISCGGCHTIIIKNDGTVWACGDNSTGELGLGYQGYVNTITQVNDINNVKQVDCGFYHTAIVKNDGTVWACGDNSLGQLDLGSSSSIITFTQIDIDNAKKVSCGPYNIFILKNDGTVWACGENDCGQLGLGTSVNKDTFTQVTNTGANTPSSSEINRLKLYVYLLDNEIPVTEIMDIDTMLELLVISYGGSGDGSGDGSTGSSSGGIDIVCATSLPETVVENQIVIITSNTPLVKEMRDYSNSTPTSNEEIIIGISTTKDNGAMIPYSATINNTVLTLYLAIAKGKFYDTLETYNGYIGRNGEWLQFSVKGNILYYNGYDAIGLTDTGNWSLSTNMYFASTSPALELKMQAYSGGWLDEYAYYRDSIDLTNVREVRIVGSYTDNGGNMSAGVGFVKSSSFGMTYPEWEIMINLTGTVTEVITDVSSLTGNYYFGTVNRSASSAKKALKITEFELIYD